MLDCVASISEKIGKMSALKNLEAKPHLRKNNRILLRADEQDEHVTEYVKKLLNVMEYEVPYTSTVLMEKLGLKSKETFRKNYMNPAMQLQLVQMTIPEKPKSRNQRYIRR